MRAMAAAILSWVLWGAVAGGGATADREGRSTGRSGAGAGGAVAAVVGGASAVIVVTTGGSGLRSAAGATHLGGHVAVPARCALAKEDDGNQADHGNQPHEEGVLDQAGTALAAEAAPARQIPGDGDEIHSRRYSFRSATDG